MLKNLVESDIEVFFISEDDHCLGHSEPMIMHWPKQWVKDLLPVWKLSVLSVALAGIAVNLPMPVPNINGLDDCFTTVSDLCQEAVGTETETAQLLNDLEVLYKDVVVKGNGSATAGVKLDETVRVADSPQSLADSLLESIRINLTRV